MDTRAKAKSTETNFHGGRSIPSPRWWICALLFVSTVINYIDRNPKATDQGLVRRI
jgi:hypothetical protein